MIVPVKERRWTAFNRATVSSVASSIMDCQPGEAILRAERLYHDTNGAPVEFAVSYYNPRHYSYRLEMRRCTMP